MELHIKSFEITNLGNIEHEEYQPGGICIRTGRNATGKTSGLRALRAALAGGDYKDGIRQGEDEGTITVRLNNGMEITRTFSRTKPAQTKVTLNGTPMTNPQTVINGLRDAHSIDILQWLNLKEEDAGKLILESIHVQIDPASMAGIFALLPDDLRTATGVGNVTPAQYRHGLDYLEAVRRALYESRTVQNRESKRLAAHIDSLKRSMPESTPPQGYASWREYLDAMTAKAGANERETYQARETLSAEYANRYRAAEATRDEAKRRLEEQYRADLAQIENQYVQARAEIDAEKQAKIEAATGARAAEMQTVNDEIAKAKMYLANEDKVSFAKADITESAARLRATDDGSAALTKAMERIDAYRESLIQSTPIPGLTMDGGRLMVDGIPITSLNTARLLQLSLDIALLRMNANTESLRAVIVDNLECLDPENRTGFLSAAMKAGIQVFGAAVGEEEQLRIMGADDLHLEGGEA